MREYIAHETVEYDLCTCECILMLYLFILDDDPAAHGFDIDLLFAHFLNTYSHFHMYGVDAIDLL